jgi:hypothetical protein
MVRQANAGTPKGDRKPGQEAAFSSSRPEELAGYGHLPGPKGS